MQIGIDLGGTKTEGIGLDGTRVLAPRRRVATPAGYAGALETIARLVAEIEADAACAGSVGVGIPGTISLASGLVKNANSTWLNGRPIASDLETRLGRPVRVANDANCFTLSESVDGAGQGAETVFGVILGTGVGGGISIRQHIHEGPNRIAGEWGHSPLPWMTDEERADAPRCWCGKHACIETFLSGPAFEREYARRNGVSRTSREIARAAGDGEPAAVEALGRYHDRLARGIAMVINLLDPDTVILGGGMSNLPDLPSKLAEKLPTYVFSDSVTTTIAMNAHGDSSGVRGAAWLWDGG